MAEFTSKWDLAFGIKNAAVAFWYKQNAGLAFWSRQNAGLTFWRKNADLALDAKTRV